MTSVFFQPCEIANNQFVSAGAKINETTNMTTRIAAPRTIPAHEAASRQYLEEIEKLKKQVRYR